MPRSPCNIPAQAGHDPNNGETDPLGREPGEFLQTAQGRTVEQWNQIRVAVGSRIWERPLPGWPSPGEGGIFKREWWGEYTTPRCGSHWAANPDEVAMSWGRGGRQL